ncbi:hypothetical protein TVAG_217280 [Trichomonas vaginalis G3]|uniref:Uncharacterized protein n=1 Tax=Trichomonas vaginalis (strain ATCC PRA-98 / G3) TaxID=412133 RepID=A2EZB0_TRIV3|nr:hypothetical protein TVAGG3_0136410 [Trichomonas vaginalis G3]EAY01991.1 hypothetical protein TVAG_217280 [Trichomonas vaginalis G3]KAI5546434.1 hypothetical protein TVAGG3_0136410 [Trichomonas vaginalis G3]|eukprot:XP_001330471.1 hypothetical protein [Trichomonas vaginalis G3]
METGEGNQDRKPKMFALFSDDGKSFSFRSSRPAPPVEETSQPEVQVKTWEQICHNFLTNPEEITNFQGEDQYNERSNDYSNKNRNSGKFNKPKPNVFIQKLRNSGKLDKHDENDDEQHVSVGRQIALQKEKEAAQHQFLVLRKAAMSEAKLQKKRAKL